VAIGAAGAVFTLGSNLTVASSKAITFSDGTLNLATFNISTGGFVSISGATRVIQFGTGAITVTGSGASMFTVVGTNLTYTGTPTVNISNNSATAGTITTTTGFTETNVFNFNITTGTYALAVATGSFLKSLNFTGFTGTWAPGTATATIYGSLTLVTGMTFTTGSGLWTFASTSTGQTITTAGKLLYSITFNGVGGEWILQDDLTLASSTQLTTLFSGTLNLNNKNLFTGLFRGSDTSNKIIAFGTTGGIYISGTGVMSIGNSTFSTYTGSRNVYLTNSSATSRSPSMPAGTTDDKILNLYVQAGTGTVTISGSVGNLDFTGFSGLWAVANGSVYYGDIILSNTMGGTGGSQLTLGGTTSTVFNGADAPLTFAEVRISKTAPASVTLTGNLNIIVAFGARLNQVSGGLNSGIYNVTTGTFAAVDTLNMGSGAWTITGASFSVSTPSSAFNAGTSTISLTSATAKTFTGGSLPYYNINQGGAGALTIDGTNSFNNITNTVQPATVTFTASTTQTFANFSLSGTAGNLVTANSSTLGTQAALVKSGGGRVSANYLSIRDLAATPSTLTWYAGANSTNTSNNTGWIFTAAPQAPVTFTIGQGWSMGPGFTIS
jgi:hypothetical protein